MSTTCATREIKAKLEAYALGARGHETHLCLINTWKLRSRSTHKPRQDPMKHSDEKILP